MRKIGLFALMTTLVSLGAFADTVVTSKTYVDAKVQAQGSTTGSILSASSPDDKAPSSKAVYTALQGIDGATPYTGTGLISVNDHEISTTAQANVLEGVQIAGVDQTITSKKVNLGAAAGKAVETAISSTAANNTDAEVPTAKAVYDYVNPIQTAVTALQSCTHTCTSSDPTNAPNACDLVTINCVETGA